MLPLHEHRPPKVQLLQIAADQESVRISYGPPERGCFPVEGIALYAMSSDPAKPGKVLAVHLNEDEGEFRLSRAAGESPVLAVLAFDDEGQCSLPSFEPMVGALADGVAKTIQAEVQTFLVGYLTPERLLTATILNPDHLPGGAG